MLEHRDHAPTSHPDDDPVGSWIAGSYAISLAMIGTAFVFVFLPVSLLLFVEKYLVGMAGASTQRLPEWTRALSLLVLAPYLIWITVRVVAPVWFGVLGKSFLGVMAHRVSPTSAWALVRRTVRDAKSDVSRLQDKLK